MREWNSYSDDIMIDEDEVKEYTIRFKTTEYEVYKRIEKFFQRLIDESNCSEKPNNCELQTIRCPKCGRTDYIRDMEKDMGIKGSCYEYKCINCNTYIKDEPQTERSE